MDKIQGLNLVAPNPDGSSPSLPSNPSPSHQQQQHANSLLPGPSFAGYADLDLWTNVAFAQDEPFVPSHDPGSDDGKDDADADKDSASSAVVKKKRDMLAKQKVFDHHRSDSMASAASDHAQAAQSAQAASAYDFASLFGSQFPPEAMNLNQLLFTNPFQPGLPFVAPFAGMAPPPPPATQAPAPAAPDAAAPPAKKPRSRKTSTVVATPTTPASSENADLAADDDDGRPVNTAEDKRRRNTQASARFRLKKKEREAAMESRCKELESKVGELERECEALRRENGWLKGLVVGVTGGTGMPIAMPTGPGLPTALPSQLPQTQQPSSAKRKRDNAHDLA